MTKWALFLQPVENSGNFFPLQHLSPSNLQQSQIQKQLSTFSPFLSLSLGCFFFFIPLQTFLVFFRSVVETIHVGRGVLGHGVAEKSGEGEGRVERWRLQRKP